MVLKFTWSWLSIEAEAEPLLALGLWLLVDEAEDDNTKELSELSELGLGAEASTWTVPPPDPDPPSQPRFEAAEAVVIILLLWNLLLDTLALVQYGLVVEIIALFTVTCWPLIGSAVTNTSSSSSSRSSCRSRQIKINQKVRYFCSIRWINWIQIHKTKN